MSNEHSASLHLECSIVKLSWKLFWIRLMKCSDTWLETTPTKWLSRTWAKIDVLPHKILPDQCVIFSEKFTQLFVEDQSNIISRNIELLEAGTSRKLILHLSTGVPSDVMFQYHHPYLPHSFVQMLLQIQNSFPNREAIVQRPLQTLYPQTSCSSIWVLKQWLSSGVLSF